MICPFCSQRNPRRARRCIFCDNPPAASVDETAVWPPRDQQRPSNLPPPRPGALESLTRAQKEETRRQERIGTIVAAVIIAVGVLYGLIQLKCG